MNKRLFLRSWLIFSVILNGAQNNWQNKPQIWVQRSRQSFDKLGGMKLVDCVLDLPSKRVGRADFGSVEGGLWTQLRCCERTRLLRVRGALCFDGFAPSI